MIDWAYGVANILQIKPSAVETTRALIALCSEIAKSL